MSEKGTFLLWWWLHACNPSAWEAKAEFEASLGYKVTLNVKNKDNVKTKTVEGAGELAQGLRVHTVRSCRGFSSVPSTSVWQLTFNSSSRQSDMLFWHL